MWHEVYRASRKRAFALLRKKAEEQIHSLAVAGFFQDASGIPEKPCSLDVAKKDSILKHVLPHLLPVPLTFSRRGVVKLLT